MSARIGRCFAQLTEAGQEEANERSHYEAYELKTHRPTLICIDIYYYIVLIGSDHPSPHGGRLWTGLV